MNAFLWLLQLLFRYPERKCFSLLYEYESKYQNMRYLLITILSYEPL